MDMRDIEQLHAQYAQPPLTIDISPAGAATAPHLGYGGASSAPAKASTSPFTFALGRNQLLWGLGFVAIAALMFAIGTSIGKRESRAGSEQAQPLQPASDASSRAAGGEGHEWPGKRESVFASEAAQAAASPVTVEAAVVPASAVSAVPAPAEPRQERSPAEQPKTEAVKRSAAPPAPPPAKGATVPAPAKTTQQLPTSAAPARNTAAQHASSPTDIKMF